MQNFGSILMIGLGNMAGAMLTGWLAAGIGPECFTAVDPVRETAPGGVRLLREVPEGRFDLVILGIKPQMLDAIAPQMDAVAGQDTLVLSMLAGVEVASLRKRLPQAGAIVRVMPNLAAAFGKSANSLYGEALPEDRRQALTKLVELLGATAWLASEDQFHAVTALAGSGPGFVYRFIEALAAGGAELGLDRTLAQSLASQMVEGAAMLAAASESSPGELAQRVASKGGTTEAGLEVLDRDGALCRLIAECLRAASDRSREMAEKASENG